MRSTPGTSTKTVVTLIAAMNEASVRANMLAIMQAAVLVGTSARRTTPRGIIAVTVPAIAAMHVVP